MVTQKIFILLKAVATRRLIKTIGDEERKWQQRKWRRS
jgi:hypothetical protein